MEKNREIPGTQTDRREVEGSDMNKKKLDINEQPVNL